MAKAPSSVIGVDLGRYSLKSVLLQRKAPNRYVVTNFASRVLSEPADTAEALGRELKGLFKEMGGAAKAKACAVGVSSPEALIRIIEQPETPTHLLREALRLNGMGLLNQDCREFVLDCDKIPSTDPSMSSESGVAGHQRYLVGGLPRKNVAQIGEALDKAGAGIGIMQLGPICAFNAFEFAHEEIFNTEAFFLVDIGHTSSTVMVGVKRELILVRTIDFGGKGLIEALTGLSGEGRETVFQAMEQEDEVMVEYTRVALNGLVREIQSSIGFLEHRREETVRQLYISGGAAKSRTLLKVLSEELQLPCETWSAVSKCEALLPQSQRTAFDQNAVDLNVACGAAAEFLKGN
ncbi:MAG: type pilus assembly protein PilM [Chthoniobacter sp.]|jgi:Tfp pilus assembly PilM family ATPase|nr:type pilus assembly protein PilM [Chthoniobacter sp.]